MLFGEVCRCFAGHRAPGTIWVDARLNNEKAKRSSLLGVAARTVDLLCDGCCERAAKNCGEICCGGGKKAMVFVPLFPSAYETLRCTMFRCVVHLASRDAGVGRIGVVGSQI